MHPPLPALIQALLEPGRYPDPAPRVELVQTGGHAGRPDLDTTLVPD